MGTSGLVDLLDRRQLEAVLFAQVSIGADPRIRRAAVNEALIQVSPYPSIAASILLAPISPALFGLGFLAFMMFWRREHFTLARLQAADAVAARTTLLPDELVEAYALLAQRATRERYRIAFAGFVDPFSLTNTGPETRKLANDQLVSTTTGEARATLKARALHLQGLLTGAGGDLGIDAMILTETEALQDPAHEAWYPDPFEPVSLLFRLYRAGRWQVDTRTDVRATPLQLMRPDPG